MINWIKFSERQPEKEGHYLCLYGEYFVKTFWWSLSRWQFQPLNKFGGCQHPDYWAEINPPLVKRSGMSPICRDLGKLKALIDLMCFLQKESPMPEKPLCKDCTWYLFVEDQLDPHLCQYPCYSEITGERYSSLCSNVRGRRCYDGGDWDWEPKEKIVSQVKLCIDCKWVCGSPHVRHGGCDHPKAPHSLVDNNPIWGCEELRYRTDEPYCGQEAKWFEPKEKKQ